MATRARDHFERYLIWFCFDFDFAHKQYNGIIKEWLHCLTSESKGRFLVNIMLMFGSA